MLCVGVLYQPLRGPYVGRDGIPIAERGYPAGDLARGRQVRNLPYTLHARTQQ